MTKDFQKFEDLTATIYDLLSKQGFKAEKNVKLTGPDGNRQIDVLIEGKLGPIDVRTIIECKDYNVRVDVTKVDELHSKMRDVKAHVAILVSRKGFTKGAIQKAKRLGIKLNTVHLSRSEKWDFNIDIPIVVEEVLPDLSFEMNLTLDENCTMWTDRLVFNDINISEKFIEYWNSHHELKAFDNILDTLGVKAPFYIRDAVNEEKYFFSELKLFVNIKRSFFLGNLKELDSSYLLNEILESRLTVMVNMEKLGGYQQLFARYSNEADIPNSLALKVKAFAKPTLNNNSFSDLVINAVEVDKKTGLKTDVVISNRGT